MQHAVFMAGAGDADVVGQSEAALEGTGGDAAVQVGLFGRFGRLAGGDMQRAFLHFNRQFLGGEAGNGDRDAVGILGGLFDVVGRIAGLGHISRKRTVHQVGDTVETDGGTVKGGEVETTHVILHERCQMPAPCGRRRLLCPRPVMASGGAMDLGSRAAVSRGLPAACA